MRRTVSHLFQCMKSLHHENPLGLPRSGSPPHWPRPPKRRPIKGVSKVVAVSSAKGGVGKSTIAANLSLAFARLGYRTGILDTDLFGPSIPTLFNLSGEPRLSKNNQLIPLTNYGVKTMSMGYLVGEDAPVVWRGPMVMKAMQQLLHEVDWGGLDILVMDLPPGTGDTQLTITQQVLLDGVIVVSTPHKLSVRDAVKGINMFKKVNVPITGLVQNMSLFKCPDCNTTTPIFGSNEALEKVCRQNGIEKLGDIPLHPVISEDADKGKPTVVSEPSSDRAKAFMDIAAAIIPKVGLESPAATV